MGSRRSHGRSHLILRRYDGLRVGRRLFISALLAAPVAARADRWPTAPIRVIIPGPPGGLIDVAARTIGDAMEAALGQPWLIDPRPGANGVIAAQALLAAPADGYTVYLTATAHVVLPFLRKVPFDVIGDFQPIAMIGNTTSLVCVPQDSPADTLAGLIAYARRNPGRLNYLNSGNGTVSHLLPEMLNLSFGVDVTSVYYNGLPPGVLDLLNSRLDIGVITSGLAVPHVRAGRLKAIAIVGAQRLAVLPDVPTLAEQDLLDLKFRSLLPLYGRREVAPEIVERINGAIAAALADPATRSRLETAFVEPLPMTPARTAEAMFQEHERLGRLIQRLGIKADGAT